VRGAGGGKRIASSNSPTPSVVRPGPANIASTGIVRVPSGPAITACA
jgi:hypothetical protein